MRILSEISGLTLRTKLVAIIMLSGAVCLLVSLTVLAITSASSRYRDSIEQITGLSNILAENSQAALLFSDEAEARRLLESLSSHREIASAWLVSNDGVVLASWNRRGSWEDVPADYRVQSLSLHADFWARRAELFRPVIRKSEQIGYVLLKADYSERWSRQLADFAEGLGAGLLALLVIYLLSNRLQRVISRPLGEIADAAHAIAENKTYALRVPQRTDDEIGELVLAFNNMLHEIQIRDENLTRQRDQLEVEVGRRTEELRTILGNTPDTIARYDTTLRRTYVNPAFAAMLPGGLDAVLSKKPSEYPGGANSIRYEGKLKEVLETGKNALFELQWSSQQSEEIYSQIRLTPERDFLGNITSVLAVGRDITELKAYQTELQRKELAKTRFLAAAGHDMRQPLAAANLFIDALKLTETSSDQEQIIQRLEQAMSNFNNLLDALLNVSKLDAGMIKPEYRRLNVTELLSWVEQSLEPLATDKQIRFKLYFPMNEVLVVKSDIGLIQSVLMNLVSNAIKFTATGGIMVSARRRGSTVLFQVWDTGMGIESDQCKKIFDEFYQVDNQHRDRTKGLGLGLSIVRRALLLLGQEITCRSRVGRGSVFGFSLPLAAGVADIPVHDLDTPRRNTDVEIAFVQGKHIVVVEDDTLVAEALSNTLTIMGARVKIFHSAEEALLHEAADETDCFVVDFMLGGSLNGIQLLELLTQKLGRQVAAVVMTGDTSPGFVAEAAHCAWPVLHKPLSISKLIGSMREQVR